MTDCLVVALYVYTFKMLYPAGCRLCVVVVVVVVVVLVVVVAVLKSFTFKIVFNQSH